MKPIHYFLLLSAFAGFGLALAMSIVLATDPMPLKKSSSSAAKPRAVSVSERPLPTSKLSGVTTLETLPPARRLDEQDSGPSAMLLKAAFRAQPLVEQAPLEASAPSNRRAVKVPEIRDWMLDDLLRDSPPRVANSSGRFPAAGGNSIDSGQGATGQDNLRTRLAP